MIESLFIKANTKAGFQTQLQAGNILDNQIAFIIDSKEIWTQGTYFPCPYTKEQIDALISAANASLTAEVNRATAAEAGLQGLIDSLTGEGAGSIDNKIQTAIDAVVNGAPGAFDTLKEIADWIQDDQSGAAKMAADIANKVDKVSGKGLSTNDYTNEEKDKLSGIASGAEVNLNTFSNVDVKVENTTTTVAADTKTDTITLIQGSNITLTPDATNGTVTIAAEGTTYSEATTTTAGLMSADDKTKLNGIEAGAGVNVQSDWNATSGDAFIKNKPTIPAAQVNSDWNATSGVAQILNKPTIPDSFQWYGKSSTAAATVQKEVSIPSITSLKTGQIIVVQPTVTSTVANSTLKLNNFDAYPMRYNNAAITTSTDSIVWSANIPSIWIFDGDYWVFAGHGLDTNTTYSSMSVAEGTAGTATSARVITAANLKEIIDAREYTTNTGTVTSVGITVPTGLRVTGSPITTSGTLAIALASGYVIPQQTTLNSFLKGTIEVVSVTADNNSYSAGTITQGTQKHVIFNNGGSADYIVTIPTTYRTPDGQPIELTVPQGGYAEANFMNINGTVYVRGL